MREQLSMLPLPPRNHANTVSQSGRRATMSKCSDMHLSKPPCLSEIWAEVYKRALVSCCNNYALKRFNHATCRSDSGLCYLETHGMPKPSQVAELLSGVLINKDPRYY